MNTDTNPPAPSAPASRIENPAAPGSAPIPAPAREPEKPRPEKNHWGTWAIVIIILLAAVVCLSIFRGRKPKPPPSPPVSITVTNVLKGDINIAVTSLGSVQPIYTASMSPRVDGQILTVNYTEGQVVASNQLLAVIDPGPYQAQVISASGQLTRDKALLEGAQVDLKRYQAALAKNAISQQQADDQVALVHQDEGAIKYDQGQLDNANVQLGYCYIRAPFAGRVGLRLVDPGNVVHAANTNALVVVAQLQPITVIFNVAEDYLPQIEKQLRLNPRLTVEAWDRSDEHKIATGEVLALNNLIDTSTGTVRIRAIFTNEDLSLFPNQFVNAKLIIQTLHDRSLIPGYAIQHNPDGDFVYLLTNRTLTTNGMTTNFAAVTMRTVTAGVSDNETTAINSGLEPGDQIALDNFNKLGEGVKIIPHRPAEENQPGGAKQHHGGAHKAPGENAQENAPSGRASGS
jgi:multidrug efflux system membrane fusion protein